MAVDKIKIAHLYPNELNLYGDSGNVLCLYNRLVWRGYNVSVEHIGIGDRINDFDILFIGGGQDREMKIIERDLRRKADMLSYSIRQGRVVLAICGGYQILGQYYKTFNGDEIKLTGALPFYTVGSDTRMIGNFVYQTEFGKVVGFENHSGKTYLGKSLCPLGKIITGFGNNGEDKTEGVLYKNTFGTYAHGPVLPKNPEFADELITRAVGETLQPIDDTVEKLCHNQLISRFG
ncbi:MAG: type 1 glutamine amidotransferase [Eubacterium sp.]